MIKVTRFEKPKILQDNAESWTQELIKQVALKGSYRKVDKLYKERYRQDEVKETLEKMYNHKCCYCESGIGTSSYGHIEHLRPKSNRSFHNLSFEWKNLHWVCQVCNTSKKDQWDNNNPILDPAVDNIDEHLNFDIITGKVTSLNHSIRAETAIKHSKLNRKELITARKEIIEHVIMLIYNINNFTGEAQKAFVKLLKQLIERENLEYSAFINTTIDQLLIDNTCKKNLK